MKKLIAALATVTLLAGCGPQGGGGTGTGTDSATGYDQSSTNVGLKPGVGRVDSGGGVSAGDSPREVRSNVTGTATYENPSTNTAGATNTVVR